MLWRKRTLRAARNQQKELKPADTNWQKESWHLCIWIIDYIRSCVKMAKAVLTITLTIVHYNSKLLISLKKRRLSKRFNKGKFWGSNAFHLRNCQVVMFVHPWTTLGSFAILVTFVTTHQFKKLNIKSETWTLEVKQNSFTVWALFSL